MSDESVADVQGTEGDVAPGAHEEVTEAFVEESASPAEEVHAITTNATAEVVSEPVHELEVADETLDGPEPEGKDETEKQSAIDRKLSRENQALRKRAKEAEAMVKQYEDSQLSEQEKQQRRLAELEEQARGYVARLRESSLSLSVSAEVARLNIVGSSEDVVKLLDTSTLEYDEETDSWIGIDEAIAQMVEDRPWMLKPDPKQSAPKDANPANPARRRARLTRDALAKMSQAEIDALPMEDIHLALATD